MYYTLAMLYVGVIATATAGDWPQFRGENASGVAADANPPIEFSSAKGLLWKIATPEGHSSPCIIRDRIYLTGVDRKENTLEILALDRKTGKEIWRKLVKPDGLEQVHALSNQAATTPVSDGKRVYVYFGSHGLLAWEWDGKLAWQTRLPRAKAAFGTGASPVLAGELILINRDYPPTPQLLAFRKADGQPVWATSLVKVNSPGPQTSHATPVIWKGQVLLHRPDELSSYSLADGSRIWWVQLNSNGSATPVVSDDTVYVNALGFSQDSFQPVAHPPFSQLLLDLDKNGDGKINKPEVPSDFNVLRRPNIPLDLPAHITLRGVFEYLDEDKDGGLTESELQRIVTELKTFDSKLHGITAIQAGGKGDVTAAAVRWRESRNVPEVPAPLAYNGRLYTVMNGGILSCLSASTGKLRYRSRIGAPGPYFSSPVAAAGRIYVASAEGVVTVLKDGDELTVLARNDIGEPVYATPAPVGDILYVRSKAQLWAFTRSRSH
jgi:outer membrane protein assembly factor BamB